jgi:hypothetical protein
MSLIHCAECGREISTEAESCPGCGFPVHKKETADVGPRCYACSAPATTRCVSCNALSCARHLQSIFVSHGRGGAYELRCRQCYATASTMRTFGTVMFFVILGIAALMCFVMFSGAFFGGP